MKVRQKEHALKPRESAPKPELQNLSSESYGKVLNGSVGL